MSEHRCTIYAVPFERGAVSGSKVAKERKRIVLEGDVPSPLHMPSGCAFRTRCKYATEQCAQACPPLVDRGDGHQLPVGINKRTAQSSVPMAGK